MAIEIKHAFTSLKGDGGDATLVKPSHWNAVHSTSMKNGNLLGRLAAGVGAFEEIPISAYMAALLASANKDALADALGIFSTGDVKWSYNPFPSTGWFVCSLAAGTIGNATSGADMYAGADAKALYVMLYTHLSDASAPVNGGRSGNALNDFNASKPIGLRLAGRAPVGAVPAGGTAITARSLGALFGSETVTLLVSQIPGHTHSGTTGVDSPDHAHGGVVTGGGGTTTGGGGFPAIGVLTGGVSSGASARHAHPFTTDAGTGSGQAHNNEQLSISLYAHVKL